MRTLILPLGGSTSQHVLKTVEPQCCQLNNSMTARHQYGPPLSKHILFISVSPCPISPIGLNPSSHSHLIPDAICIFFLSLEACQYICSVIYPISINQRLTVRQEKIMYKNIAIKETASALKRSWELMIAVGILCHSRPTVTFFFVYLFVLLLLLLNSTLTCF